MSQKKLDIQLPGLATESCLIFTGVEKLKLPLPWSLSVCGATWYSMGTYQEVRCFSVAKQVQQEDLDDAHYLEDHPMMLTWRIIPASK